MLMRLTCFAGSNKALMAQLPNLNQATIDGERVGDGEGGAGIGLTVVDAKLV